MSTDEGIGEGRVIVLSLVEDVVSVLPLLLQEYPFPSRSPG
jgi:hypothetical protein